MYTITKENVADLVSLEVVAELHQIHEKLSFLEKKYGMPFEQAFEKSVSTEECYEIDDDLIEWKAYIQIEKDRQKQLEDIRHERFQVA